MAPIASAVTRVLITGFGPFGGTVINPSWSIASRLPASLPNGIELLVHPNEVPVAFHPVIEQVPPMIDQAQPDISLHIGLAEGRTYFAVEQTSGKYIYSYARDNDGLGFTNEECDEHWSDQPQRLSTDLDLTAVVALWQNRTANIVWPSPSPASDEFLAKSVEPSSPVEVALREDVMKVEAAGMQSLEGDDVRWSDDVGTYLCAFIYYTSMVEMSRSSAGKRRDTAFMHVPNLQTQEEIDMGVDITIELVQSLVQSWREQRAAEGDF